MLNYFNAFACKSKKCSVFLCRQAYESLMKAASLLSNYIISKYLIFALQICIPLLKVVG